MRSSLIMRVTGACLVLVAVAPSALGQRGGGNRPVDIPEILHRALRASGNLRYAGERTFEIKERTGRKRYRETILKDGARLRIEFSNDSPYRGQIIVENGTRRWHYKPDVNEIEVGPARRDESIGRLMGFLRSAGERKLKFTVDEGGAVAGAQTQKVTIADGRGNAVQRLWIAGNGMILKRELYDDVGSVVGAFEFVRIDFTPKFHPSDFVIQRAGAKEVTAEDLARRLMRKMSYLPVFIREEGFVLEGSRAMRQENQEVLLLFYRTPQGPMSLIQSNAELRKPSLDRRFGGRSKSIQWQLKDKFFLLIGNMPEDALRRIAQKAQER